MSYKIKFFFGVLMVAIFAMAVSFSCLSDNKDEYAISKSEPQKTTLVVVEEVVGQKNVIVAGTPSGTVRIRGKF